MWKLVLFLLFVVVGFIPSIVAFKRDHNYKVMILILNILLGGTIIGWIILLVWALSEDNKIHIGEIRRKIDSDSIPKKNCTQCRELIDVDCTSCPKCGYRFSAESIIESKQNAKTKTWKCKKCGGLNYTGIITCKECGNYK